MRVRIDMSAAAQGRAGIGRYCTGLAKALARLPGIELSLLYHTPQPARFEGALAALACRHVPVGSKPWRTGIGLAEIMGWPLDGLVQPADVFHATDHLLPPLRHTPSVLTLHDLAFLAYPATHRWSNRIFLRLLVQRFVRRATRLIADSEATRREVIRYYSVAPDRISVVHLGVEPRFGPQDPDLARRVVAQELGLAAPYVLYVGAIEPRKNLSALVAAYARLVQSRPDTPRLAIAGAHGWMHDAVRREVRNRRLDEHVRFLGRVPDSVLPTLYAGAELFVYPSLYEGFGLPPLEALACGTPVLCSDRASLPEVVGDAAVLVDPTKPVAIAAGLERLLEDEALRRALRARGLARAARFTWERTARETVRVYEQAILDAARRSARARPC